MTIDLRLLEQALVLARFRNYTRAASFLRVSQPALSRNIAGLERALGVRLFDRGRRGAEPTAYGRLLLERGRALLADEAALHREIGLLAGLEAGDLAVAAGPFASSMSVGLVIARLVASHPRLRVEMVTGGAEEILRALRDGKVELAVVGLPAAASEARLTGEPMPPHAIWFFCRPDHPLAGRSPLALEEIFSFPMVSAPFRGEPARRLPARSAAGVFEPGAGVYRPAIQVESFDLARRIARASDAILPASPGLLREDVEAGRLLRLDYHEPWMKIQYGLFQPRDRTLSPAARAFIAALREVEAELQAGAPDGQSRRVAKLRLPMRGTRRPSRS